MVVSTLKSNIKLSHKNRVSPIHKASFLNVLSMKKDLYFNKLPWREHNRRILENLDSYGFDETKYKILAWLINTNLMPAEVKMHFGFEIFAAYIRYQNQNKKWVLQELRDDNGRWERNRQYSIDAMVMTLMERLTNLSYLINNKHESVFEYHQETYIKSFRNLYFTKDDDLKLLWEDMDLLMFTDYEQLNY